MTLATTYERKPLAAFDSHPLLETLQRAHDLGAHMSTIQLAPEGEGWMPLRSLVAPSGERLCELMGRVANHFQVDNRRAPASLFVGDIAFALMALATACYLLDHRVPHMTPDSVWLKFDERGDVGGLALSDYRFAALADDPAAHITPHRAAYHADCVVLSSVDELQEHLLAQASECLQLLIQAVRSHSTLGVPAMWALAADYTASAPVYVGRAMKEEERALALARQLSARQSPLRRKRDFIHIEESGLSYDLVDRLSCCLYYQCKEGRYCSSCPHRPPEERINLIKTWLANTAAKEKAS